MGLQFKLILEIEVFLIENTWGMHIDCWILLNHTQIEGSEEKSSLQDEHHVTSHSLLLGLCKSRQCQSPTLQDFKNNEHLFPRSWRQRPVNWQVWNRFHASDFPWFHPWFLWNQCWKLRKFYAHRITTNHIRMWSHGIWCLYVSLRHCEFCWLPWYYICVAWW